MSQDFSSTVSGQGPGPLTELVGGSLKTTPTPKLNLRRLETIQRWLQAGALLTLLIFVGLIGFSAFKLRGINREIADAETLLAKKKLELEDAQRKTADWKAKYQVSQNVSATLSNFTRAVTENDPAQAEKIKQSIEANISDSANPNQIPARIYLQIGREDQRRRASEIAQQLQTNGYIVPGLERLREGGVENVGRRTPRVSQIRFYAGDDVSRKDVNDIVTIVSRLGITLKEVQLSPSRGVRPRHYELWFGDDF